MSTKYHIITPRTYHEIVEESREVISASPAMDWAVGLKWDFVRAYCKNKGWQFIPVIEAQLDCKAFDFDGDTYDVCHDGVNIKRLMKNGKSITWTEVPQALKGLL